ncbi:MAG: hypothetical protein V1875_09625 [Candidatus Altiarchaeota archaeon]
MDKRTLSLSFFATIILLTLLLPASSQMTEIKVQIVNSLPKAYDVAASSVVKSGQTDIVWCTGSLEDLNSYKDIKTVQAFIGMPSSGGYIQRQEQDFLAAEQTSVIKGEIVAGFVLGPQAQPGEWACVITGQDSGDAKASNASTFKVAPKTCENGLTDGGEESVDCAGQCLQCHCFNGVLDDREIGVDCGGVCTSCPGKGTLALAAPKEVTTGEVISVQVKSDNKGMASLIRATKPSGKTIVFKTEDSGVLNLQSDETGIWNITADLYGYKPATAQVQVNTSMTPIIIGAVILLGLAVLALIVQRSRKKPEQSQVVRINSP